MMAAPSELIVCILLLLTLEPENILASKARPGDVSSPFDDLSPSEIQRVVNIIRNSSLFEPRAEFPYIRMQEPKKADWLAGEANQARFAEAAVFEFTTNILSEVIVDLRLNKIVNILPHEEGITPPVLMSEDAQAIKIIRHDARWQAAILRRGFKLDEVELETWNPGTLLPSEIDPHKRLMRAVTYHKNTVSRYHYFGIIEGVVATVDLVQGNVISLWDDEMVNVTTPKQQLPDFSNKPPLTPLRIEQPEGSSIKVAGQEISWYKWRMRYSIDPIHGLQIYHVTYAGDCAERSVLYKISLGDMFVPYGASGRGHRFRHAFDAGEYGIGKNISPLKVGVDVPENSILFPCSIASEAGKEAVVEDGCVAAYERDIGTLFKHQDWVAGHPHDQRTNPDVRRGRQLVITLMATVANYDYTFDYIFHMDGVIDIESRLTGIVLAKGVQPATNVNPDSDKESCLADCKNFITDYIVGPPHQHFFSYRIDMDVDGVKNHVAEVNVTPDPVGENPYPWDHGTFSAKKTLLETETHRDYDFHNHRTWHVINSHSRNGYGTPRGYALKPGGTIGFTYLTKANPVYDRVHFVRHPFWATRYKDPEQSPTSKFPRTGKPNEGLPEFVSDGESLEDEDAVLWYTFGVTHSPRPEEWPIMNMHFISGFSLVPQNFMSQNSEMSFKDFCP